MTLAEIKGRLRAGKYAWPGGYPIYFIAEDGEALSFEAVRECWREICHAHIVVASCPSAYCANRDWLIAGAEINYEDGALLCAHTGERIESAYAEGDHETA